MHPVIERLKKLAAQKITKGKLQALQTAQSDAISLLERLEPKSDDDDTKADFESACDEVETALDDLDFGISDLDGAEEPEDREDAVSNIEDALDKAVSAFEELMQSAVLGTTNPHTQSQTIERECEAKLKELRKLPKEDSIKATREWIESGGSPEIVEKRRQIIAQILITSTQSQSETPPSAG